MLTWNFFGSEGDSMLHSDRYLPQPLRTRTRGRWVRGGGGEGWGEGCKQRRMNSRKGPGAVRSHAGPLLRPPLSVCSLCAHVYFCMRVLVRT